MDFTILGARSALVIAGAITLLGTAPSAGAQRMAHTGGTVQPRPPRVGTAASPPVVVDPRGDPRFPTDPRFPVDRRSPADPRYPADPQSAERHQRRGGGTTIVYVPAPGQYGYGYPGAYGGGYAYPPTYGGAYDVNGRPLSAGFDAQLPVSGFSYTPDLSGAPYGITEEGMMVVDFTYGDRRAFPSCAGQTASRDPNGRPRTIFYQPTDYWMVLRPGQRGRVQGVVPVGTQACYAIDSTGRVVLRATESGTQ